MLVSLNELKKYVDLSDLSSNEICSRLTFAGIEVEECKKVASATNIVIGQVVSCIPHPDSDHLHVCKVDVGNEVLNIVCGAPNCRNGIKVIVAKDGALLNNENLIKKGEIRGVPSEGMLCSLVELGVDKSSLKKEQIEGIEELPIEAPIGNEDVLKYLNLDDEIIDLSLLANRSDCYSIFNIARELGALFKRKVNILDAKKIETYNEDNFNLKVESEHTYSFYTKVIKGIEVKESPNWLKNILLKENINSVNNIVDLGNYIMLLTGQPVHCYDLDKLDNELIVTEDYEGSFEGLDNNIHNIKKGDITMLSHNNVMCLGGIIGSKDSMIDFNSKNLLIEVANFDFATIRKTSIRCGISTDSSLRYIKGLNKDQSEYVVDLFSDYLKDVCDFKDASNLIKIDKIDHSKKKIKCSKDYINNRLGSNFSFNEIVDTLNLLNFEIENINDNEFIATIPSYRIDCEGKADLSEEIIRYFGFDYIKEELPIMETTVGKLSSHREKEKIIENYLLSKNLYEVLTYTLINEKDNSLFNYINKDESIEIFNPLTEDHKVIRKNILSSLLRCIEYNLNHNNDNFDLFEISNVYSKNNEEIHLSIGLVGNKYSSDLLNPISKNFYDLKGLLEGIFKLFNISENRIKYSTFESNEFHPGRSAEIKIDNKLFGVFGEIHPLMFNEFSLNKNTLVIGEFNLSQLFKIKSSNNKFIEISKYPSLSRDIAFIVSKDVKFVDIKQEIKKTSPNIKSVNLFDIYEGNNIDKKYRSLGLRISIESMDKTLKDNDINEIIDKVKSNLIKKFNVEFR